MKRHNRLRAVVVAGLVSVVVGAAIGPAVSRIPAGMASKASATLAALRVWLYTAATHVTTTQLIEAAAIAWLVFVASLILLARSRPRQPHTPHVDASNTTGTAPVIRQQQRAQAPNAVYQETMPALPKHPTLQSEAVCVPVTTLDSTRDGPSGRAGGDEARSRAALTAAVEAPVETGTRAAPNVWEVDREALGHSRSRALALTGAALVHGRLLRYGLFLVVEDADSTPPGGDVSRRVAETLVEQMTPVLMSDRAMGSAQFSALLKLTMIRAGLDLRRQSICAGTDLGAAIAAVTLIGHTAHVVTVNACWAYVFRPGGGLTHITRDHAAMATQAGNALADPETLDAHPRHDQVFVKADYELAADDIDIEVSELAVHPGDLLLLGSPGLPRALSIPRIETQLRVAADPRVAASLLVRAGTHLAEKQDFSVIVVKPQSEQSDWLAEFGIATTGARTSWRSDSATDHLSEQ